MIRKEYALLLGVALLAGLVGGALSDRFFTSKPVFAHNAPEHAEEYKSGRFVLVDKDGNTRGGFLVLSDGSTMLHLMDKNGKITWKVP